MRMNKAGPKLLQEITGEMARLQVKLEEAQRDADRLHLEFSNHLKVFAAKMRLVPHPLLIFVSSSFIGFPRS